MAGAKGVTILINAEDLKTLKEANYRLCFAKKVQNSYNVVWQAYGKYLSNNDFEWTPQFQLFGTNKFKDRVTVNVTTNEQPIGLYEQATLDVSGLLGPASTGGTQGSVTLINDYGDIHPGLSQLSDGVDGDQVVTPIYVAEAVAVMGTIKLTPVEMVQVWFEQNIETSTMFSDARSLAIEIDLTNTANATRLYKDGKWSTPSGDELDHLAAQPKNRLMIEAGPIAVCA